MINLKTASEEMMRVLSPIVELMKVSTLLALMLMEHCNGRVTEYSMRLLAPSFPPPLSPPGSHDLPLQVSFSLLSFSSLSLFFCRAVGGFFRMNMEYIFIFSFLFRVLIGIICHVPDSLALRTFLFPFISGDPSHSLRSRVRFLPA